jgi:hypothetical protein
VSVDATAPLPNKTRLHALWGDLFEVAVKRGCLAILQEAGLLERHAEHLQSWRSTRVADLHAHLLEQTGAVDPVERARLRSTLDHLLVTGWGLGWTAMRECLLRLRGTGVASGATSRATGGLGGGTLLSSLYCLLNLPDRRRRSELGPGVRATTLWQALGLSGLPDPSWAARGDPANADLILLLQAGEQNHLICLECSLHAPPDAEDFTQEGPHLDELERYVQRVESRGVFTRIAAEVDGERFAFSDGVVSHLGALTTPDKPLYKLCQGSSYAFRLLDLLGRRGHHLRPVTAHVIAVTNAGVETLRATFGDEPDPRARLMVALGDAYRRHTRRLEHGDQALDREIAAVQAQICRSLPPALRDQFAEAFAAPPSSRQFDVRLRERIDGFANPAAAMARRDALRWVEDAPPEVDALLGGPPRSRVAAWLKALRAPASLVSVSLRDLHAAALLAGLSAAERGRLTVLAAEGHPGIGKTTAVLEYLGRFGPSDGFLFFYASPRTVINGDVMQKVARDEQGRPSGVLALTTSSRLLHGVRARRERAHPAPRNGDTGSRYVDGAVVADGVQNLQVPAGSIEFLAPDDAQRLDEEFASSGFRKRTWDERLDVVETRREPGVLMTLARAARACLDENPSVNRLVLTAAIQGYRPAAGGVSTVERLSGIFPSAWDTPRGLRERRDFARRIPTIIAMVDEIAGDGAGAPFVHALATWLERQFVEPFAASGEPSPFRVILVLSDASLANDAVLASYLASTGDAPEKVIISGSRGPRPLRLAGSALTLGGRSLAALHVMADGFPACDLEVEYAVRLDTVDRSPAIDGGVAPSPRKAIRDQYGQARLRAAVEEVFASLSRLPCDRQVILFAQDKVILRDIRRVLVDPGSFAEYGDGPGVETFGQRLTDEQIGMLDSSVSERDRRRLIQPAVRDSKRVFLMTSSGARGVSFPHATTLIAFVPTFAVESGFMEIAQLIFRGRGVAVDPDTGEAWDGDALDRKIVLILQDFVLDDEQLDSRQWLRRTVDLVSALVLLRATILTRITGDAGIPGQRAAVVPVGRIGGDEADTSLAQSVSAFLHEGKVYLRERSPAILRTRVDRAMRDAASAFRALRLTGTPLDPARRSLATPAVLREVMDVACGAAAPLLWDTRHVSIPDATCSLGPIWLESWADVRAEEAFRFQGAYASGQARLRGLLGNCRAIERDREIPPALRRAARDVVDILQRADDLLGLTYFTRRAIGSGRLWVCLPVDYERFCALPPGEEHVGKWYQLADPESWFELLSRAAGATGAAAAQYPVLPYFEGRPFAGVTAQADPTGLDRAFDDRYFMASSELNLLNTILFVAE